MTKNLFETTLSTSWYSIDPKIKGINITLEQYENFIKQELIIKGLTDFLKSNNFIVTINNQDNKLTIEKDIKRRIKK